MKGINNHIKATIDRLPEGKVGLEIGVWKGDTTVKLARKSESVDAVDAWSAEVYIESPEYGYEEYLDRYESLVGSRDIEDFQRYYEKIYNSVLDRAKEAGNINVLRMTSKEFFEQNTKMYDWVYVDGDHSYEGCLYDLQNVWDIIKDGGILFGDDYSNKKGSTKAVDEFRVGKNFEHYATNQFMIVKE